MPRVTVQIADDHLMFAEPNGRYLALHHDVLPPVTALKEISPALSSRKPDVLLLDIMFGNVSSLTILPALVAAHPAVRVVMVTGMADAALLSSALACGAMGYVLKDGGPAELLLAIDTVVAGKVYVTPELRDRPAAVVYRATPPLSRRQAGVLRLLRKEFTEQLIAETLDISLSTAEKHVLAIKRRLGLPTEKRRIFWPSIEVEVAPPAKRVRKKTNT
jgi:DNA-binding NarL/FixJ family response regulator